MNNNYLPLNTQAMAVNCIFSGKKDVHILGNIETNKVFEELYLKVRSKEGRLYNSQELLHLPYIDVNHPHFDEWLVRGKSCLHLMNYLRIKGSPLLILEAGCGNGWLSNQLSNLPGSKVIGLDINFEELQQGARLFGKSNLVFVYGDIHDIITQRLKFDVIVFAASIQYFSTVTEIISISKQLLKRNGEIHVLDTNFYKKEAIEGARIRSRNYYASLGFPKMADYYFHHCIDELQKFKHKLLYNPASLKSRLLRTANPFPWICINQALFHR